MGFIVYAPPRGLPHMYPVGCPVAGSLEPLGIDKGLQKVYRVTVDLLPVTRYPSRHLCQQVGRQMIDPDPWQQEKTAVVDYQVDVFPAYCRGPSDEAVPAADVARSRRPAKACNWDGPLSL